MADSAFRLLVYAVVSVALIVLVMQLFTGWPFGAGDIFEDVEEGLKSAGFSDGKTVSVELDFPENVILSAEEFDTQYRAVNFSCNDPNMCCALNQDKQVGCKVLYDTRTFQFLSGVRSDTHFRCVHEANLFVCKVHVGDAPPQLRIGQFELQESYDLDSEDVVLKFDVLNEGDLTAYGVAVFAEVYVISEDAQGREKKEQYKSAAPVQIGKIEAQGKEEVEFYLEIYDGGEYEVEVKVEGFDCGFDEMSERFVVEEAEIARSCLATSKGEMLFKDGDCVQRLLCEGCEFSYECLIRWRWAGEGDAFSADPNFAYVQAGTFEGQCENPNDCAAGVSGDTFLLRGDCLTELPCSNCDSSSECVNAWKGLVSDNSKLLPNTPLLAYFKEDESVCKPPEPDEEIIATPKIPVPPAPLNTQPAGFCEFRGEITAENNPSKLASCTPHLELLKKYLDSSGLEERGFDILLLQALIFSESSCNADPIREGCRGLMRVVSCGTGNDESCVSNCSTEENIRRGTAHLASDYDRIAKKGIQGIDAINMVLFSYNRGKGAADKAIELYNNNPEQGLSNAMEESCYYYYDKGAYISDRGNCSGFSRKDCCTKYGLGARYGEKILDYYKEACKEVNGTVGEVAQPIQKGKVVVLDPGHGNNDLEGSNWNTARTYKNKINGWIEPQFTLDFALRIKQILENHGYRVILTRSTMETNPNGTQRIKVANDAKADVYVSIHTNGYNGTDKEINPVPDGTANGAETFTCRTAICGSAKVAENNLLANEVQKRIVSVGLNDRGVKNDDKDKERFPRGMSILRKTKMPAILIETAFIDGNKDAITLADESKRQEISQAIAEGIMAYLNS